VCGALRTLSNHLGYDTSWRWVTHDDGDPPAEEDKDGAEAWARLRAQQYLLTNQAVGGWASASLARGRSIDWRR
jgi:hypothetical protein